MANILLVGESWTVHSLHQKGFDTFTTTTYEEGSDLLRNAIEDKGHRLTYMPSHRVQYDFPKELDSLKEFDVVAVSDIGSNTFLLPDRTFVQGEKEVNKLKLIKEYVLDGGNFIMFGGYMAFSGINGSSRYGMTDIADVLPVECLNYDDSIEKPEGITPVVIESNHPIFEGISSEFPHFLGYNKTILREEAKEIATINEDPFIAYQTFGKGKSLVFTSDVAPHWGSKEFVTWKNYPLLWDNIIRFMTN